MHRRPFEGRHLVLSLDADNLGEQSYDASNSQKTACNEGKGRPESSGIVEHVTPFLCQILHVTELIIIQFTHDYSYATSLYFSIGIRTKERRNKAVNLAQSYANLVFC